MPGVVLLDRKGQVPIITCRLAYPKSHVALIGTPVVTVKALVDTGATNVVINANIIAAMNLPRDGTIGHTVVGHGFRVQPAFRCDIIFDGTQYEDTSKSFTLRVNGAHIIEDKLAGYDAILGWDVLNDVDMTFSRDGTLAIQMPDLA